MPCSGDSDRDFVRVHSWVEVGVCGVAVTALVDDNTKLSLCVRKTLLVPVLLHSGVIDRDIVTVGDKYKEGLCLVYVAEFDGEFVSVRTGLFDFVWDCRVEELVTVCVLVDVTVLNLLHE